MRGVRRSRSLSQPPGTQRGDTALAAGTATSSPRRPRPAAPAGPDPQESRSRPWPALQPLPTHPHGPARDSSAGTRGLRLGSLRSGFPAPAPCPRSDLRTSGHSLRCSSQGGLARRAQTAISEPRRPAAISNAIATHRRGLEQHLLQCCPDITGRGGTARVLK